MKGTDLVLKEHHPPVPGPSERLVRQAVAAWLARALRS